MKDPVQVAVSLASRKSSGFFLLNKKYCSRAVDVALKQRRAPSVQGTSPTSWRVVNYDNFAICALNLLARRQPHHAVTKICESRTVYGVTR